MRSLAREAVFKYLFSRLFNQDDEGLFDILLVSDGLKKEDAAFANDLLKSVDEKYDFYLSEIDRLSQSFSSDRILNADKCAIVLGMAELDAFKETPVAVVINEAVNIAAKYSTEKSPDFVNGILAAYQRGE